MPTKSKKKTGSIRKRASSISKRTSKKMEKKIAPKKKPIKRSAPSQSHSEIDSRVAENFIALQKVMVNLAVKFDGLSNQISKLLDLFEISAKALAEKDYKLDKQGRDDKELIKRMDNLYEQNKILARGMTLVHDKLDNDEIRNEFPRIRPSQGISSGPQSIRPLPSSMPRPSINSGSQEREENNTDISGYQKSLSSTKPLPSNPERKKIGEQ